MRRQCGLVGLAPASYYYVPTAESAENLGYLRLLDEEYTRHPFYGVRKMTVWLQQQGHAVGPKRVRRLLRAMGLMAVYAQPRLSLNPSGHRRFPYLLKGVLIVRPNQVWSTDITYIRLRGGFVYLAAVLDWYSRYVLAWELSITLEADFCVSVLERALAGQRPEIFNTDQGVQFTSAPFVSGQAAIDIAGVSKFGVRNANYDVAAVAPTWAVGSPTTSTTAKGPDTVGTTQDPKLVVTYPAEGQLWIEGADLHHADASNNERLAQHEGKQREF